MNTDPETKAWLKTRPPHIQALAEKYPLGVSIIMPDGRKHWLIGYNEAEDDNGEPVDMLVFSPIDPWEDYNAALQNKIYVCAEHLVALQ